MNFSAYQQALQELSALLDAPAPPALGTALFDRFEYLLEMVEQYEAALADLP